VKTIKKFFAQALQSLMLNFINVSRGVRCR